MTPILLLHAFPLDARMWEESATVLDRAGYDVIAPNLPGRSPEVGLEAWARRVLDVVPGDFVPVGCSMGGYLIFELWRQASRRIRAAVLADTRAGADTPEGRQGRADTIRLLRENGFEPFWEAQAPKLFSPEARPELLERARAIAAEQPIEGLVAALETLRDRPDSRETVAEMDVPVLVVVGEEDVLTPPSESEAIAAALALGRLVRIPGAGHLSPLEKAGEFGEELSAFLSALA